jgi:hypothetical protein
MLTRRDFLKITSAGLLAGLLAELLPDPVLALDAAPRLGRVTYSSIKVHSGPAFSTSRVGTFRFDNLLEIAEQLRAGEAGDFNRVWYRIGQQGYVYSGGVQPVENILNQAVDSIPGEAMIGEMTVPYAETWWGINRSPFPASRMYYSSAHFISEIVVDRRDGTRWYKAYDHLTNAYYYVRPEHIRVFSPEELAPLSPQVPPEEKHIEVRLDAQAVLAFEGDEMVWWARTATGKGEFGTPTGLFRTYHKRPAAHMVGGDGSDTFFDLPGVPFASYIDENGVSFHGTYWHNDYGAPRSHGCINLTPADARWLYRWTLPVVPSGARFLYEPSQGTSVRILETTQPTPYRRMT